MIDLKNLKLDLKAIKLISEIDSYKITWSHQSLEPYRLDQLKKTAIVESVASSTRIEGATLSDNQVLGLLSNLKVAKLESRDEQEVVGYAEVMELIIESYTEIPITENYVKQLHQLLLKYSDKDSRHRGEYKKNSNNIAAFNEKGEQVGVVFETASPFDTPKFMTELISWYNEDAPDTHPLIKIAVFVLIFLEIHPFEDGNGRLSRILTNLLMLKEGYSFTVYSSMESIIEARKERYYLALRTSQKNLRKKEDTLWEPWINFFLQSIQKQVHNLQENIASLNQVSDVSSTELSYPELPPLSEEIMCLFLTTKRLTFSQINDVINANPNTIKKHLQNLVKENYIELRGKGRGAWYSKALKDY